jgi:hypothetical protein
MQALFSRNRILVQFKSAMCQLAEQIKSAMCQLAGQREMVTVREGLFVLMQPSRRLVDPLMH